MLNKNNNNNSNNGKKTASKQDKSFLQADNSGKRNSNNELEKQNKNVPERLNANLQTTPSSATTKKEKIVRTIISFAILIAVLGGIYLALLFSGALKNVNSIDSLKNVIESGGNWSYLVFGVLQFLQVTFIPLPAVLTTVAGVAVLDSHWTVFWISLVAVMLGSLFAFWLGRTFGRRMLRWIVGEEDAVKWSARMAKGKYAFFLMMLLPGFPDDILCIVAGATPMTYGYFTLVNLIARPLVFAPIVFLGDGSIIPYSGWGIPVWIVLVALAAFAFYLSIKHQEKIENYISGKLEKISNKFKKK